ncbi:putative enzyme related to lactoylglutathione lyase [Diaminobutyricimonas aerilata]|uniref:Putative enzyme related to lactoylglutathione lyase n=1 Tax=Diaminobutyricimonas aerilata TaxID=1162967 RepID=A0A2M9CI14_9MICO|nr:VOC family protein [Diaminobutyricimonas aerilata]PJJ71509.1 putative enzyme related to lactoylglutathione lyase [Diaminobutyricimonas aerilata]
MTVFGETRAFSGFSVDDLDEARRFYVDVLGLELHDDAMGLTLALPGGGELFVYPKENHEPATFTVLNFAVRDIDAAVDALRERGVETKIYSDDEFPTDHRGIMRSRSKDDGPDICWFRDPAGNVLSVLSDQAES